MPLYNQAFFTGPQHLKKLTFLDPICELILLKSRSLQQGGYPNDAEIIKNVITQIKDSYTRYIANRKSPLTEDFLCDCNRILSEDKVRKVLETHRGFVHYLEVAVTLLLRLVFLFLPKIFGFKAVERFQFPFLSKTAQLFNSLYQDIQYLVAPEVIELPQQQAENNTMLPTLIV